MPKRVHRYAREFFLQEKLGLASVSEQDQNPDELSYCEYLRSLKPGQLIDEFEKEVLSKSDSVSAKERLSMLRLIMSERMQ